eukprot:1159348-Pelagomonas_calceolata.AAC.4
MGMGMRMGQGKGQGQWKWHEHEHGRILPKSIKEMRIPRAEALRIPFTKRKRKRSMGIRRATSSSFLD